MLFLPAVQEETKQTAHNSLNAQRRHAAQKLGNARILQIHFHTFRHWKATMEYHRTKDILHVMRLLGHKSIANTLIYTQLMEFEEDDKYCTAVASDVQEARKLLETDSSTFAATMKQYYLEKENERAPPNHQVWIIRNVESFLD